MGRRVKVIALLTEREGNTERISPEVFLKNDGRQFLPSTALTMPVGIAGKSGPEFQPITARVISHTSSRLGIAF